TAVGTNDLLKDIVGLGGPDKRLGIFIVMGDVIINGSGQFGHTGKDAATQTLSGYVAKEALHHIEPGGGCGREVDMETWMLFQPFLDLRMLMSGIVITHQMQVFVLGCFTVDLLEKVKPLDVAMALLAAGDNLSIQGAQGREQGRGAMAFVVMSHGRGPT